MQSRTVKAWNYQVSVITDLDRQRLSLATSACASGSRCADRPTHWVSYECITGPGKGIRIRKRAACERHARQFAQNNGLAFRD